MADATDILVISAHPQMELSRINRTLMRAASTVARAEVRDPSRYAFGATASSCSKKWRCIRKTNPS